MAEQKAKSFVEQREVKPLRNRFTVHLTIYIFCVVLTFWDMLGWRQFPQNAIQDRAILFAVWGLILIGHYIYLRFSSALASLKQTVEHQRHALSVSLFNSDEEAVFVEEERVSRLKK
jgi:uncharacterized membrane protein (DUF485 family)